MVFFEQILDVVHAADVSHLQQLTDLFSTGISFQSKYFLEKKINICHIIFKHFIFICLLRNFK